MNGISTWAATLPLKLEDNDPLFKIEQQTYSFSIYKLDSGIVVVARWPSGGRVAFRVLNAGEDELNIDLVENKDDSNIKIILSGIVGKYEVKINLQGTDHSILHYTSKITPTIPMFMPFSPRDIVPLVATGKVENTSGIIHTSQVGGRSGAIYANVSKPKTGSFLYFQNLSALADYCEDTRTSANETVGGQWPEIGFALPATSDSPLSPGKEYIISDAYVSFSHEIPTEEDEIMKQYLDHLATIYLLIPKPATAYHDWIKTFPLAMNGLLEHRGCWSFADGHSYLNAYVSDYKTPPEIMVQLSVLIPMIEYHDWNDSHSAVIDELKAGLPAFYDDKLQTIVRWLPAQEDDLDGSEEQKQPMVMDAWYLHHPLHNLTRLAKKGDETAKKLLLDSIDYAIKVAHHFNYEWPVFYKMDTLEVIKAETQPGQGGEKDVPGAYAHLMYEVWELTGEDRYLNEAKKAALRLEGLGFDLFYQANNTAFTAATLLKLFKKTKNERFLNLSYVCIASIMKNVRLWECNYGLAKHYPTFFGLYPLKDAPYTAAYEEQEVFAAFKEYLEEAKDLEILPSVKILLTEYTRYFIHRAPYYYPSLLPKEVLSPEVTTGEIDPELWIALEDLHDGWEQSGTVGQEVYGAGVSFGIMSRHFIKIPDSDVLAFVDYPFTDLEQQEKSVTFLIQGDPQTQCRLLLLSNDNDLGSVKISKKTTKWELLKPTNTTNDKIELLIEGNTYVKIELGES